MERLKTELLAPARDADTGRAAVDYGADALYIGGPGFGARVAAANPVDRIAGLVRYAHGYGVRVYATLNTLVYEHELPQAGRIARDLAAAGVDALIVQDMAYLRMGIEGVEFHASTQTHITSPEKARFLARCGFSRLILERGLTLEQIRTICAAVPGTGVETFVHGAICVGHSGQCYMSRSMGPRSGNRGECSQPCRMTYDLVDGAGTVHIKGRHLLSLRDLNLAAHIPALLEAGVRSFKIEGRLKDISYVKNVVAYYRGVIDVAAGNRFGKASAGRIAPDFTPDPARTFSRGSTAYYLGGKAAGAASFDTPKAVGHPVGRITEAGRDHFTLDGGVQLAPGDGICFTDATGELRGTRVNRAEGRRIVPNRMDGLRPGTEVLRNHDHRFHTALDASRTRRIIDITASVDMSDGLGLTLRDGDGNTAAGSVAAEPARNPGAMLATLREQLSKCGDTPFEVTAFDFTGSPVPFVPVSALNALRRAATAGLWEKRCATTPPRDLRTEDRAAPYPAVTLGGCGNVTNSLSEAFYRDHGVTDIAPGHDLADGFGPAEVMRTPYCLRREIGQCLRGKHTLQGPLYLRHGVHAYRLGFDCENCEMTLEKA